MNTQFLDRSANALRQGQARSDGKQIAIGDGFSAKSYMHSNFSGLMDPLIMVDHFVMTEPTFGTHAHAGMSAVTVLFEDSAGAFRNRDSLGGDVDLAPGDLYWFTAARGAMHNEEPRPDARTHGLQVFVNLPAENRDDMPAAFHLPANGIPRIAGDRTSTRLVLSKSNGVTGARAPDVSRLGDKAACYSISSFTREAGSRTRANAASMHGSSPLKVRQPLHGTTHQPCCNLVRPSP